MSTRKLAMRLALVTALTAVVASLPSTVHGLPACPSDGIARTTSGSTGTGTTCNNAFLNLAAQERAKMTCAYGVYDDTFIHNGCHWNGSSYQATGWFNYECMTNCYGPPEN